MASWADKKDVPPGHGENAPEVNVGEARCRCGMRLNRDGTCPIHGTNISAEVYELGPTKEGHDV